MASYTIPNVVHMASTRIRSVHYLLPATVIKVYVQQSENLNMMLCEYENIVNVVFSIMEKVNGLIVLKWSGQTKQASNYNRESLPDWYKQLLFLWGTFLRCTLHLFSSFPGANAHACLFRTHTYVKPLRINI